MKIYSRGELLFICYVCIWFIGCMTAVTLSSCVTMGVGEKALSPKQQSVVWMSLYNAQYKETQSAMLTLMLTPNQVKQAYYAKKIEILTELHPVLKEYDSIATSGGTPSQQMTMTISYLIYRLTDLIVGSIE